MPSLKKLQSDWAKKLADSGFEDIETPDGYLKNYASSRYLSGKNNGKDAEYLIADYETKARYYRLAGQFLYSHKFANEAEKQVWVHHAEGVSFRKIVKLVGGRYNFSEVYRTIRRLKNVMFEAVLKEERQNGTE